MGKSRIRLQSILRCLLYNPRTMSNEEFKEVKPLSAEETIMFALERAGVIKPLDEISEPIDRVIDRGALAKEQSIDDSELIRRIDHKALGELATDEAIRSDMQQTVVRLINERMTFDEDQIRAVRNYGQWHLRRVGLPEVQQTLKEMIFRDDPELPEISEEAAEIAPDVYWMMLREQEEAKKNAEVVEVA